MLHCHKLLGEPPSSAHPQNILCVAVLCQKSACLPCRLRWLSVRCTGRLNLGDEILSALLSKGQEARRRASLHESSQATLHNNGEIGCPKLINLNFEGETAIDIKPWTADLGWGVASKGVAQLCPQKEAMMIRTLKDHQPTSSSVRTRGLKICRTP